MNKQLDAIDDIMNSLPSRDNADRYESDSRKMVLFCTIVARFIELKKSRFTYDSTLEIQIITDFEAITKMVNTEISRMQLVRPKYFERFYKQIELAVECINFFLNLSTAILSPVNLNKRKQLRDLSTEKGLEMQQELKNNSSFSFAGKAFTRYRDELNPLLSKNLDFPLDILKEYDELRKEVIEMLDDNIQLIECFVKQEVIYSLLIEYATNGLSKIEKPLYH